MFNDFVEADDFDAYLKATDVIWPMVHPDTPSADEYFRNQISGAINVAFAYKIPLLVHCEYAESWEDLKISIEYKLNSFQSDLQKGVNKINEIKTVLEKNIKFDPVYQEKKYLDFVFEKGAKL